MSKIGFLSDDAYNPVNMAHTINWEDYQNAIVVALNKEGIPIVNASKMDLLMMTYLLKSLELFVQETIYED